MSGGFNNPFASLGPLKDSLPEAPESAPDAAPTTSAPARKHARAVVRMERSGRGGKEVTVIEQLELTPPERDAWLKALKSRLGCGGVIEGDALVLQGDHRKRLPQILADKGVKKVIVS